jgi:Flp pilus assembly pilin Flp
MLADVRDERGAEMVEWIVLVAVLAVVALAVFGPGGVLQNALNGGINTNANGLNSLPLARIMREDAGMMCKARARVHRDRWRRSDTRWKAAMPCAASHGVGGGWGDEPATGLVADRTAAVVQTPRADARRDVASWARRRPTSWRRAEGISPFRRASERLHLPLRPTAFASHHTRAFAHNPG